MKQIFFFIFSGVVLSMQSQILNPGFESVTGNKPDNYNLGYYSTYNIKDTSDAFSGAKAALIKGYSNQSYTIQGAICGIFSTTGKPAALNGWYKCFLQPGDSLVFNPYVYETTLYSPFALAYAFTTSSSAVYKQFSAPISYATFTGTSVDTVYTGIYLSGPNTDPANVFIPSTGTWAIIDELSLGQVITSLKEDNSTVTVEHLYPQPGGSFAYMIYLLNEQSVCSLGIFDVSGKEVKNIFREDKQTMGRYKAEIDLHDLAPGLYFVHFITGYETKVLKIIKE